MHQKKTDQRVPTFCALCVSRCGAMATVENGVFRSLHPDPSHPTGKALCIKGKVAPEIVYHPERLLTPLKRSRPKGDPDPGWERISWDEALDTTAARLQKLSRDYGPECVVFAAASPSTTAISDSADWIDRLRRAFGSPNLCTAVDLCAWGRYFASVYTYGASVPGRYLPDLEHAGCILYWGYNPTVARLVHATSTVEALNRGARLIVVDPRRAGLAHRADEWLRVRPGTDAALALSICHVMIERGWFDRDFVQRWTNGPLLVRTDNGRLLRARDLGASGDANTYVAWHEGRGTPVVYSPERGAYETTADGLALFGEVEVSTPDGTITCHPAFQLVADECRRHAPKTVETICGVSAEQIERTARLLWEARPVAYYAWSGVEQQSDATQIARAIAQISVLTGSFDDRGGNVSFPSVRSNPIDGPELLGADQRAKSLGLARRPLGPARWEITIGEDLYTAALESRPYKARGLFNFGSNMLLAYADSRRGREALMSLDFYAHADLFMNPTAELADIVLPVASPFETEALAIGFEVSEDAQSLVQLRRPVVAARGEARSDIQLIFDLATRLGLGEHFWNGDIDAAHRHRLEPSGISLEQLRADPSGVRVPLQTRYRKYAEVTDGIPRGFDTPTRKIELYSETLHSHGYPPVPEFRATSSRLERLSVARNTQTDNSADQICGTARENEASPGVGLVFACSTSWGGAVKSTPEMAQRFPLTFTNAKSTWFCESQHRGLPSLRRRAPDPLIEMHPDTARSRNIDEGDWVRIETPEGSVRARAKLNDALDPDVVVGQHGWWQACAEIGAPSYDPFSSDGANINLVMRPDPTDPVGGSVPLRAYRCNVVLWRDDAQQSP